MGIYTFAYLYYGRLVGIDTNDKRPLEKEMLNVHNELQCDTDNPLVKIPILKKMYYMNRFSLNECVTNIEGVSWTFENDKCFHKIDFIKYIINGIENHNFNYIINMIDTDIDTDTDYSWYVSIDSYDTYSTYTEPKIKTTYLYNVINVSFSPIDKETHEKMQKNKKMKRQLLDELTDYGINISSTGKGLIDKIETLKKKLDNLIAIEKELIE